MINKTFTYIIWKSTNIKINIVIEYKMNVIEMN